MTDELARTFNLPARRGLLLQTVVPGSGAAQAGLRAGRTAVVVAGESYRIGGDLIVAVDGPAGLERGAAPAPSSSGAAPGTCSRSSSGAAASE